MIFIIVLFCLIKQSKRRPKFFWVSAAAPLTSVILGSVLVYLTHAENHGVQVVGSLLLSLQSQPPDRYHTTTLFSDDASSCNHVQSNLIMPSILGHVSQIGYLKKGLNPPSATSLTFMPPYIMVALKTGIVTGVIALAVSPFLEGLLWPNKDSWCPDHCSCSLSQEGIAVGRSFAMFKNYHIDGNKEMIAIGTMNMVGSLTSCYLTTGTVWSQDHFAVTCCT